MSYGSHCQWLAGWLAGWVSAGVADDEKARRRVSVLTLVHQLVIAAVVAIELIPVHISDILVAMTHFARAFCQCFFVNSTIFRCQWSAESCIAFSAGTQCCW